jgi:hypothetical protein
MSRLGLNEMSDYAEAGPTGQRWLDVFPWIESVANERQGGHRSWWLEPIDARGTVQRDHGLVELSMLALERLKQWSIGQIFPHLPPRTALEQLPVPVRARIAFRQHGLSVAADLMSEALGAILDWSWISSGTVDSILRALGDASIGPTVPVLQEKHEFTTPGGGVDGGGVQPGAEGYEPLAEDTGRTVVCWLDAFPWIESAANTSATMDGRSAWWRKPIESDGALEREQRLAELSDLAIERLSRWTIGQIFPGLPPETVLDHLPVTTRARNAFHHRDALVGNDLMHQELGDLLDWPQVGVGTVDSILRGLAVASIPTSVSDLWTPTRESREFSARDQVNEDRLVAWREAPFVEDLRLIARWYAALGVPARPLLNELPPGTPAEVRKAKQRLETISAADVLEDGQDGLDASALLGFCIGALDRRTQEVLARRFFADRPKTLDDLGESLGLTRERVRQIEAKARTEMMVFLEPGGDLEMLAATVRELIGNVLPLNELITWVPALGQSVEVVGQPAWRVLDRLDDAYEIMDSWCVSPTVRAAQALTLARLEEAANAHGVVHLDDLEPLNPRQSGDAARQTIRSWLAYCGYELHGDHVFTRTQSVGDRAAAVLSVVGSPMDSQGILNQMGIERTLGSLKNAMAVDDRFERVDRDRWALAEWGLESYAGVRALVREEVARGGGQMPIDELVERIAGKYSVSASSVIVYASSPPFEAKNGIVRFASTGRQARKSPTRTRRLYRRGSEWLYRVRITKEHLRGSGSVAPVAIAGILGLQYGTTRQLPSALGPQSVSWTGTQPAFGTIRRFLVAEDTAIDTEIFLVIADDGTFRIERVDVGEGEPLGKALALVGAKDDQSRRKPRIALARAIGLPDDSPAASVIGGYRERGDEDVAEVLLSIKDQLSDSAAPRPGPAAEISEILDLL